MPESRTILEWKVLFPIVISFFALTTSLITLYMSHLREADMHLIPGEYLEIQHYVQGILGMHVVVSVVNHGAQPATISKLALLIEWPNSNEGYLLEPVYYSKFTEKGAIVPDSWPVPITVPGRESVTKFIEFRSSFERPTEFQLTKPGKYFLTLLGWLTDPVKPQVVHPFPLLITDEKAKEIEENRPKPDAVSAHTVRIRLEYWRNWTARYLTELQVRTLVGDNRLRP